MLHNAVIACTGKLQHQSWDFQHPRVLFVCESSAGFCCSRALAKLEISQHSAGPKAGLQEARAETEWSAILHVIEGNGLGRLGVQTIRELGKIMGFEGTSDRKNMKLALNYFFRCAMRYHLPARELTLLVILS